MEMICPDGKGFTERHELRIKNSAIRIPHSAIGINLFYTSRAREVRSRLKGLVENRSGRIQELKYGESNISLPG